MASKSTVTSSAANAALKRWRDAWSKVNGKCDKATDADRNAFVGVTLEALPIIRAANAENGKKVRRTLRAIGYRISDRGYEGFATKRDRKAKRERKVDNATIAPPVDANVSANANTNA